MFLVALGTAMAVLSFLRAVAAAGPQLPSSDHRDRDADGRTGW
jgi:hypothetical protein